MPVQPHWVSAITATRRSRYVNNHPYVLHLWKPIGLEIPLPPTYMVGIVGQKL